MRQGHQKSLTEWDFRIASFASRVLHARCMLLTHGSSQCIIFYSHFRPPFDVFVCKCAPIETWIWKLRAQQWSSSKGVLYECIIKSSKFIAKKLQLLVILFPPIISQFIEITISVGPVWTIIFAFSTYILKSVEMVVTYKESIFAFTLSH